MRPMRWSLAVSSLIHAAILAAAIVVLPPPSEYEVEEQESIPVDIVDIDEISARQAVSKDAKPEPPKEKPAPPKVEEAEKPKPAPEPAKEIKEAARLPEPEPTPPEPEPLKELFEAAAAAPQVEPEPQPDPEPKPEEAEAPPVPLPKKKPVPPKKVAQKPEPKFNADDLAALLNKIDGPKQAPPKPSEVDGQPKRAAFTSLAGSDERISADAIDWLRERIERCWSPPVGVREAQNLVVKLRIELQQSGEVIGVPEIMNASSDPLFDIAAASAVRAVLSCQPYNGLPPDKYQAWRDIILNFDPRRMLAIN